MLIIDAYNTLHCSHLLPDAYAMVSATGLARLLDDHDVPPHRGDAIVVADGSPKPDDEAGASYDRVRVIFSGSGRDADTVIEQLVDTNTSPRSLIVVSNDRRLQRAARRRRANIWTSEQFMLRLARALGAKRSDDEGATGGDMGDADHWMEQFGLAEESTDTPAAPPPDLESETDRWMREFGFEPDEDD